MHYKGTKCECEGITFDSIPEKEFYILLKKDDLVTDLKVHEKILLQEGFRNSEGKKIRDITFSPDYHYFKDGQEYYTDCKPCKELIDSDFNLRWKMLMNIHKSDSVRFRLVAWDKKAKEFVEI